MKSPSTRRAHNVALHVDHDIHPDWLTGAERIPAVGEEVYCTAGAGTVAAVLGRTGNGSRLLEIRLPDPAAKPFFAAASNVLVTSAR